MRGLSSSASASAYRVSPAIGNLPEKTLNQRKPNRNNLPEINSPIPLDSNPTTSNRIEGKSTGISSINQFNKHKSRLNTIDHHYISRILSRNDWYLLLNHELKAKRLTLNARLIASVIQNLENPLHPLRFYVWVLNINPLFAKNQSIRAVLANALNRKGPVLLTADLIQDIRNSGCRITEDFLCVLVDSWGRLGLAKYISEVFEQISYMGLDPSTRLYNAVIDALVKSNSVDMAYLKFQQMRVDNCIPDRFTYNILIHGVCKGGVMDEALRLVKQMEKLKFLPNVFTYSILIYGYCNAKRVDEAFRVLERMKEKNVSPNEATFRSLVNGVFRSLPPNEAYELLSKFVYNEPILPKMACDSILHSLSNHFLAKELALFLKKCLERGYKPNSSTINITMTCLIKKLDLDETCEILDSLIDQNLKPGFNIYLNLIEALYNKGKVEGGNCYLTQIFHDKLVSNVCSYNMIIDCFSKAQMMDRAKNTLRDMLKRGVSPNTITFNTMISGYCKVGDIGEAREMLKLLLENDLKPDIFTFSSIIDGLCHANKLDDAYDCFEEMVNWGVSPNAITYNILIRSLCLIGDIGKSMRLLRKMKNDGIKPDVFSFNSLIQGFCRMNMIEKAQRLLSNMLALDLSPDNVTYSAFIKAFCESRRFDEAMDLFGSMELNGCFPDSQTCDLFIDGLVKSDRFEEARDIFRKYEEKGLSLKPIPR